MRVKQKQDVQRNIKFSEQEAELLEQYAGRYSFPAATALKMLVCTEMENFLTDKDGKFQMEFELGDIQDAGSQKIVACRLPEEIWQEITNICKTTTMTQAGFIRYLVMPKLKAYSQGERVGS